MDTSDEWIRQRTGIRERRHVEPGQRPSDLARAAVEQALEQAELGVRDIDCILVATLSSECDFPGTSFFLHEQLDAGEIPCMDLRAQCSGFLYALQVADSLVRARAHDRVLVVGCEVHSTGLDFSTEGRDTSVLFGDGAGAVVVEANDDPETRSEILAVRVHAEGRFARKLWLEAPGAGLYPARITHKLLEERRHYPVMDGRFVFRNAVQRMPEVLRETLDAAGAKMQDVSLFLFHQANLRINEAVSRDLGISPDQTFHNIERFGNCSAASIPMLLAEATRSGRLERGKLLALTAFGSGFTWGSAVVRW